jgi:hypothetical protein
MNIQVYVFGIPFSNFSLTSESCMPAIHNLAFTCSHLLKILDLGYKPNVNNILN